LKHPYIVGSDVAGIVVAVGSSVKRIKVGDRVYTDRGAAKQGAYAQYVTVPEVQLSIIPATLSYTDAGAMPLVCLTAMQAFVRHSQVKKGSKVLILGASGGVGSAAVQIAKALGASEVSGTCSSKNADWVKTTLGADRVIAYDKTAWWDELKGAGYDVILDTVGGKEAYDNSASVLNDNGTFATISGDTPVNPATGKLDVSTKLSIAGKVIWRKAKSMIGSGPSYQLFLVDAYSDKARHELDQISSFIEQQKLKPVIQKVYPLNDVVPMWEESMKGRVRGKLVIEIDKQ
jgi:NADPH:quinone reductase-like Zn-dependent oxidoreductase